MKDFVEFVAKGLVDKPEDVQVVEVEGLSLIHIWAFCCPRWIAELAGKRTVPP